MTNTGAIAAATPAATTTPAAIYILATAAISKSQHCNA